MLATTLAIILNYVLVQAAVILFMLPFYLLYRRRHEKSGKGSFKFGQQLEHFFSSTDGNWLVFFWAMGEAVIWFMIPEFLLLLVIFMRIEKKHELLLYDIYGTVVGTLIAYVIALPNHLIDKLPYVKPNMLLQVQTWYAHHGILALLHQPFSGIPYKVFNYLAPQYHLFVVTFVLFAVLVRISRYTLAYGIFAGLYPVLHKFVYKHYARLYFVAVFVFSVLLYKVYSNYGIHYHITS